MALKMLSLFSGIGGIDLAAQWAGIETVAFCEIEPFCRRVLAKHWPDVPILDDVRQLSKETLRERDIKRVDVIAGGFPCQDISQAGRRAGIKGKRSSLWSHIARLAGELQPNYVIVENVAALLERGMPTVLGDLAALGYDAEWCVLSACQFGAPHSRERVFILAYPHADGCGNGNVYRGGRQATCEPVRNAPQVHAQGNGLGSKTRYLLDGARGHIDSTWGERALSYQPKICRDGDGISSVLDKRAIAVLGNSVMPQQIFPIFEAVVNHEAARAA